MMPATRPNRIFTVYREVDSPYEVPLEQAQDIYRRTAEVISRFAGPIAMSPVHSLHIPNTSNSLEVMEVALPPAYHNVLMTQRLTPSYTGGMPHRAGVAYVAQHDGKVMTSQTMLSVAPPQEAASAVAVGYGIHQLTHTFGAAHCDTPVCIMQPCNQLPEALLETVEQQQAPYCFSHDFELGVLAREAMFEGF